MSGDPESQFGAEVRRAREALGWSQSALAKRLFDASAIKLDQAAVARLERGHRTITLNEAVALGRILDVRLPGQDRAAADEAVRLQAEASLASIHNAVGVELRRWGAA